VERADDSKVEEGGGHAPSSATESSRFEVGTAFSGGPAQIPACWITALGACLGFWRRSARSGRAPSQEQAVTTGSRYGSSVPVEMVALAAAPERLELVPNHLITEARCRVGVARHGIVVELPSYHASQPPPLLRYRQMDTSLELKFGLRQLCPHPLRDRDPLQPEPSLLPLPADVREAEEVERLEHSDTRSWSFPSGMPPERDESRLAGVCRSSLNFANRSRRR
jgi:hypothetical protein